MGHIKSVLFYYYGINPSNEVVIDKKYRFVSGNTNYLFVPYTRGIDELMGLYYVSNYMIMNGYYSHEFVFNKDKSLLTYFDDVNYVLFKVLINSNFIISFNDIVNFNVSVPYNNKLKSIMRNDWYSLWSNKIDYVEDQVNHLEGEYVVMLETVNYYIGLGENAISYLSSVKSDNELYVMHRRILYNDTYMEFYNPLNFVIDRKERDIAEYIKSMFINRVLNKNDLIRVFSYNYNYGLLYARLLFPTYYFDKYEVIINEKDSDRGLVDVALLADEYEKFLYHVYMIISRYNDILPIEWIISKFI